MDKRICYVLMAVIIGVTITGCSKKEEKKEEDKKVSVESAETTKGNVLIEDNEIIEEKEDGSITYNVEGEELSSMIQKAEENIEKTIQTIEKDNETYPYVKEIKHNEDMTEFVVKVDRASYEEEQDTDTVPFILKNVAKIWHELNGTNGEEIEVKIKK